MRLPPLAQHINALTPSMFSFFLHKPAMLYVEGLSLACVDQIYFPPQRWSVVSTQLSPNLPVLFANLSSSSARRVAWGTLACSLDELAHLPPLSPAAVAFSCAASETMEANVHISHLRKVKL